MKYNLKNKLDLQRFKVRVELLIRQMCMVDLTKINPKRTRSQNSYLHLIFGYFSLETGYTMTEVKQVLFKQLVNREIFLTEFTDKNGEVFQYFKSTSDLDTKQMTIAIERFRDWAVQEGGVYLPAPNEQDYLAQIEMEIDRNNL